MAIVSAYEKTKMVAVGFEPTPSRTSALNWRLGPLGQTTSRFLKKVRVADPKTLKERLAMVTATDCKSPEFDCTRA